MPEAPLDAVNGEGYQSKDGKKACGVVTVWVHMAPTGPRGGMNKVRTTLMCQRSRTHDGTHLDVDRDVWFGCHEGEWHFFPRDANAPLVRGAYHTGNTWAGAGRPKGMPGQMQKGR